MFVEDGIPVWLLDLSTPKCVEALGGGGGLVEVDDERGTRAKLEV